MRDLKKEQEKLQCRYRLHLNRIRDKYRLYDKELAMLMGFEIEQAGYVAKLRAGKAEIFTVDIENLSKNVVREYGEKCFLQDFVPEEFIAVAYSGNDMNGCVSDEVSNITMHSGKIIEETQKDPRDQDTGLILDSALQIGKNAATMKGEIQK